MARIRHQFMLDARLSQRLDELAARPGATKSAILADAVDAWLNRRGSNELDDRFGHRLDRLTTTLGRIERNTHILIETLALFVRYELAIHAPLADNDNAGRAIARERFAAFVGQVSRQIASGKRTLGQEDEL
ncbi:CopG family transcriptional regulator [Sphingopyxis sp. 550A]